MVAILGVLLSRCLKEMVVDAKSLTQEQEIFITVLKEVLPTMRLYSAEQIIKRFGKEQFELAVLDTFGYIYTGAGDNLSKLEKLALTSCLLQSLKSYLIRVLNIPATIKTMIDNFGLLEYAFELNFPGYVQSGLLKYVINPRMNENEGIRKEQTATQS
jgi:hypothetical protein